jgi:hypothetical protein
VLPVLGLEGRCCVRRSREKSNIARTGLTVVSSSRFGSDHRLIGAYAVARKYSTGHRRHHRGAVAQGGGRWQAAHTFPASVRRAPPAICCPGNAETLREPKRRISCRAT